MKLTDNEQLLLLGAQHIMDNHLHDYRPASIKERALRCRYCKEQNLDILSEIIHTDDCIYHAAKAILDTVAQAKAEEESDPEVEIDICGDGIPAYGMYMW